jgi:hypothetical protein
MDLDNALPQQPGYQLPCKCATCTRWNNDQMILHMTCLEQRCICDERVNLEVSRRPNTRNGGHAWLAYYRCARRGCGYNLKAFSPDFEKPTASFNVRDNRPPYLSMPQCQQTNYELWFCVSSSGFAYIYSL